MKVDINFTRKDLPKGHKLEKQAWKLNLVSAPHPALSCISEAHNSLDDLLLAQCSQQLQVQKRTTRRKVTTTYINKKKKIQKRRISIYNYNEIIFAQQKVQKPVPNVNSQKDWNTYKLITV